MAETLNDKINKRPLCACCAAFSAGLVAVSFLGGATVPGIIFSAAAFLVALYAWFIQKYGFELKLRKKLNDDKQLAAAVAAGMLAIGSMIPHIIAGGIQNRLETWSGEHAVTCRVTEITSRYPYFSSATVSVTEIDGEKVSFSARLTVEQELETGTGGVLRLENAALSPIPEDENGFPAARYYAGRGIYYEIECESLVTGETEPTLYDRVSSFSARLSARLAVLCGRDEGGLASALFLGKKDALPDSVKRDFSRLGVSHLLAVSGLHLTMIVFFAEKISAAVFRKRFTPLFVSIGVAAFYAVLTGLHYSVIRAAIMLTAALTAKYAGRRADPPTSLAVAAALILAFRPSAALDAGFLLSTASVLGLITVGGPVSSHIGKKIPGRIPAAVASAAVSTLAVLFFTLPVSWYVYGSVAPVSVISNLIFIPLAALILLITPAALTVPQFSGVLAAVCRGVIKLASAGSVTSPDPLFVGYGFTPFCFLLSVCVMLLCLILIKLSEGRRITLSYLMAMLVLVGSFSVCRAVTAGNTPDVSALNAGTNDHVLADTGEGVVLIDVSTGSSSAIKNAASIGLRDVCRTNVDVIVYTHLHTLHVSSFDRISDAYLLTSVLIPENAAPAVAERIKAIAAEKGIKCAVYGAETLSVGETELTFGEPVEIKNRSHDAILFSLSSDGGAVSFCSPGYLSSLGDDAHGRLFILSHGNTAPSGAAPDGAVATSRETALECGVREYVNDGKSPASLAFRLDG